MLRVFNGYGCVYDLFTYTVGNNVNIYIYPVKIMIICFINRIIFLLPANKFARVPKEYLAIYCKIPVQVNLLISFYVYIYINRYV